MAEGPGSETTSAEPKRDAGADRGAPSRGQGLASHRALLTASALVLVLASGAAWWRLSGRESTDDAQIDGHINTVAARVGGAVSAVLVADNQYVEKGTTLVQIDRRGYEVALAQAEAELAENEAAARAEQASVPLTSTTSSTREAAASSEFEAAEARLQSARAQLREAEAKTAKAFQDLERLRPLLAKDEVSQQEYDTTASALDAARAARDATEASVRESERVAAAARARLAQARTGAEQLVIQQARAAAAAAKAEQSRASLAQARLNLEYADVKAPVAGVVSRRSAEPGQVVEAGQPLLALVPLDEIWVIANFKESQLLRIRPGQAAVISVDAYAGHEYRGHVESIAAATGSRFSILPPENATGNYVKVVQRVGVKIVLESRPDPQHLLRPGMSVVPTVLTR